MNNQPLLFLYERCSLRRDIAAMTIKDRRKRERGGRNGEGGKDRGRKEGRREGVERKREHLGEGTGGRGEGEGNVVSMKNGGRGG